MPEPPPTLGSDKLVLEAALSSGGRLENLITWYRFVTNSTAALANPEVPIFQIAHNSADSGAVVDVMHRRLAEGQGPDTPWFRLINRPPCTARSDCLLTLVAASCPVAITPDGRLAISGNEDHALALWDLATGQCLRILSGHAEWIAAIAMTPDGRLAISRSVDKTVRLWDLATGQCLQRLDAPPLAAKALAIAADGRLAMVGNERQIHLYDLSLDRRVKSLAGHARLVTSAAMTPEGRLGLSGSNDTTVRLWDLANGHCLRVLRGHSAGVDDVAITPDGRWAVSACESDDRRVRVWDLHNGQCVRILENSFSPVAITPNGCLVVAAGENRSFCLWDVCSGQCLKTLQGGSVTSLAITADGRRAVACGDTLSVWNMASAPEETRAAVVHTDGVRLAAITLDRHLAISTSTHDPRIFVWELSSGNCCRRLEGHAKSVYSLAIASSACLAVSGGDDKAVWLWDLQEGKCLKRLDGHFAWVSSVVITPDGCLAVSSSHDKTLRLWDLASGECRKVLAGYSHPGGAVFMHPNDRKRCLGKLENADKGPRTRTCQSRIRTPFRLPVTVDLQC